MGCNQGNKKDNYNQPIRKWQRTDNHSYANIAEIHTEHLHIELDVNFDNQTIYGIARHKMVAHSANQAVFDIKNIEIQRITVGDKKETLTDYQVGQEDKILGAPLIVSIDSNVRYINIYYKTTPKSEALDWLLPSLTEGKQHPFLYTQGQTILTRTWIPIQDSPSNRITYSATVKVPSNLLPVMSATNPIVKNETGVYNFSMKQAIPSYLISLAVGNLEYRKLGEYCGVYSEPELIDACTYEFADVPKMLNAAQKLYGQYRWEQYDIVVLPHSFPFGGMENPRITFANPTLIVGDRSLVTVIAHELAHSWSGNLLTNASWDDFWLNEGFTVYFENRIMEELYGKERAKMLQALEMQELKETLNKIDIADTRLKIHLVDRNPDEAMTDIAYIKGAFFLRTLEKHSGREKFDRFIKKYFDAHAFQSISTEQFVNYLNENLLQHDSMSFNTEEWIYSTGLPENCIQIHSKSLQEIEQIAKKTIKDKRFLKKQDLKKWKTQEWVAFIRAFPENSSIDVLNYVDSLFYLKNCGNAEIMYEWYLLAIRSNYIDIKDEIHNFLKKVGRLKYLEPIYEATQEKNTNFYQKWGVQQFELLKNNYHPLAKNSIQQIITRHKSK